MNKILAIVVVVIVIAGGAWALFGRSSNDKTTGSTTSTSNTSNAAPASSAKSSTNATATNSVSIENFAFMPADITIKKGTMVTWTNNDSTAHTVSKDNADTGPDSSTLTPGAVYRFTYNQVGTFKYHCKLHSDMTGSVTVTE